jgi:trehalose/maltose hydrolase-like predicted phosphorylase
MLSIRKIYLVVLIFLSILTITRAQDSTFVFQTNHFTSYTPASLGNGYLTVETSLLGSKPANSYMAWVYDHAEGDVSRIARLPAWNEINYFNGKDWLNNIPLTKENFSNYIQNLNMKEGVLSTQYDWNDSGRISSIETETFISRNNKNLAAVKFKVTPKFNGKVKVYLTLKGWDPPVRKRYSELEKIPPNPPGSYPAEWYPGFMKIINKNIDTAGNNIILKMTSKAEGRPISVAEAVNIEYSNGLRSKSIKTINNKNETAVNIEFNARANQTYSFIKYISAVSSKDSKDYLAEAEKISSDAKVKGYSKVFLENKKSWNNLWKTDIIIKENPHLQRIVHSMMFYLFCSIRSGTNFSIPPMGLANDGYYGHIFWDADIFMFPALLLMHPGMAESMVNFRFESLNAAKENAKLNGYKGAMYPWESDETGREATPRFAYQNALSENHITGDVALAQWQYYLATGDKKWLADTGYSVIKATADFWISRVSFNKEKDRYEIKNIVSVDEGRIGINNDTYTNSIAKKNLEIAIQAGNILKKDINPKWEEVKDNIYIPYDSLNQIYPTYENAPDSILGAVVTLLSYPIDVNMNGAAKKNNLENAAKLVYKEGPGAMMTITLLPVIAAEAGNSSLLNRLVKLSYNDYLHPPYNVITETPRNKSINFITGAGGFLQQIIYGYTGLRITSEGIVDKYKPMLPKIIKELTLQNFYIRGSKYDINVKNNKLTLNKIE